MNGESDNVPDDPRWQYKILWRYGAILLVAVGLASMVLSITGVANTAVSVTLLPIGFVSLVAGVVLPRIEGRFTAGPSGLSAEMLAVHELDRGSRFFASGPATEPLGLPATHSDSSDHPSIDEQSRVTIGDVWDALDEAGIQLDGAGLGHAYFRLRGDRHLDMPNKSFMDWATASSDLLSVLETWDIHPIASGKYPVPNDVAPGYRPKPRGYIRSIPTRTDPQSHD